MEIPSKIQLDPSKIYCIPVGNGYLDIKIISDDTYPGLAIEDISNSDSDDPNSIPGILVIKPYNKENDTYDKLEAVCFPNIRDYIKTVGTE